MADITIREWVENYKAGKYAAKDFSTQCAAGWYDWFCKNESLANKLKKFGNMLCKVDNDFLLDNYRVWFKNNCPCVGPLYDDMRFEPMDESLRNTHYFGISVDDKRNKSKYEVYTARNDYRTEFKFDDSREVVKFLNNWTV